MTKSQTEWWAPVERSDEVSDLFGGDTRVAPAEHETSRSRGRAKRAARAQAPSPPLDLGARRRDPHGRRCRLRRRRAHGRHVPGRRSGADGGVEDYTGVGPRRGRGRHQARRHRRRHGDDAWSTPASSPPRRRSTRRSPRTRRPPRSSRAPTTCCSRCRPPTPSSRCSTRRAACPSRSRSPRGSPGTRSPRRSARRWPIPVEEVNAAIADPAAIGLPGRGQRQRRGLAVPGDVRHRARRDGRQRAGADDRADGRRPDAEGRPAGPVGDRAEQGVDGRARGAAARGPAQGGARHREPARQGDAARRSTRRSPTASASRAPA